MRLQACGRRSTPVLIVFWRHAARSPIPGTKGAWTTAEEAAAQPLCYEGCAARGIGRRVARSYQPAPEGHRRSGLAGECRGSGPGYRRGTLGVAERDVGTGHLEKCLTTRRQGIGQQGPSAGTPARGRTVRGDKVALVQRGTALPRRTRGHWSSSRRNPVLHDRGCFFAAS
jgi:hypothetical protein